MNLQATEYGSYVCEDDPGEPTTGVRRISVTDEECALLSALAYGREVFEIGTGLGVSTRALARQARHVTTLDADPWVKKHVWASLPANVEALLLKSGERLTANVAEMAFIDGDHATESVHNDLGLVTMIVRQGGIIVVHDAKMDSVRAALDETWIHVDTHHGLAIKIV